jgi:hypothetical protein
MLRFEGLSAWLDWKGHRSCDEPLKTDDYLVKVRVYYLVKVRVYWS